MSGRKGGKGVSWLREREECMSGRKGGNVCRG